MTTAEQVAATLSPTHLAVVSVGEERDVGGLALREPADVSGCEPGDLVVVVGARKGEELVSVVESSAGSAGLLARRRVATLPSVVEACRRRSLTLLALADDADLISTVTLLRDVIDQTQAATGWSTHSVHTDLFSIADVLGTLIEAPVTIEDARSRVLAYSSGQDDVDEARTSTIIGRQVPAALRDRLRAAGVFRRLARSDDPVFVPGSDGMKARLIIPIRAGGEWLGSVWAVVDEEPPPDRVADLGKASAVLALHLLRLRATGDLARQVRRDQVSALLRGESAEAPEGLLDGPWRAVALSGPETAGAPAERVTVWTALAQRHGWRQPVLVDLDDVVFAVVTDGPAERPGSWHWLRALVSTDAVAGLGVAAGGAVSALEGLGESAAQARELLAVGGEPPFVLVVDDDWAAVVVARAVRGLGSAAPVSPLAELAAHDEEHDDQMVATICAVIDHWGEPQRAARALGVHPNTVRNRLARIAKDERFDLEDPSTRLALRLEALALEQPPT